MTQFINTAIELPTEIGDYNCYISYTDSAGMWCPSEHVLRWDGKSFTFENKPVGIARYDSKGEEQTYVKGWAKIK